jgi:hypothetical protein
VGWWVKPWGWILTWWVGTWVDGERERDKWGGGGQGLGLVIHGARPRVTYGFVNHQQAPGAGQVPKDAQGHGVFEAIHDVQIAQTIPRF